MNAPTLARFFRQQSLYIAISAVVGAIFWANGQQINPATVLVYSLCIGNLLSPATGWLEFLYAERPFPYDLLIFLPVLLVLTVPIYLITTLVVWLVAPPYPQTLSNLITTGWKFPFLITFVFGVPSFLYHSTKERLERRNVELQQTSGTRHCPTRNARAGVGTCPRNTAVSASKRNSSASGIRGRRSMAAR